MTETWKQWEGHVVDVRFTLDRFLGSSDHSAVFLTTGPGAQAAAIKFVEANPAGAHLQLQRWKRAAELSHPHLIRVLHWGRCQLADVPMLYVVTELAEENLAQILPARALTSPEAEFMLRSVLEVLAYLHKGGLAHSRLQPANVMAVGDDLKLSGDSICAAGEKSVCPREPTVYDAPELASAGPSPAADVWSLGVTLVEALTAWPSPGQVIRQGDPVIPETMPAPFLEIARECLRLDPGRRWTVPDIAARLLPASVPSPRMATRSRYVLAGFIVLVLGALLAGPTLLRHVDSPPGPSPAQVHQVEAPATKHDLSVPQVDDHASPSAGQKTFPALTGHSSSPGSANSSIASAVTAPNAGVPVPSPSPGMVVTQFLPTVSQRSLHTITGKVKVGVRLSVDTRGRVVDATLAPPGPSQYFAKIALEAARRWKFTPPQINGEAARSEWMLRFAFGRGGVEVHPEQVSR